jgi:NTP pyrophosphatase (non-canonical NTP hydrolase)
MSNLNFLSLVNYYSFQKVTEVLTYADFVEFMTNSYDKKFETTRAGLGLIAEIAEFRAYGEWVEDIKGKDIYYRPTERQAIIDEAGDCLFFIVKIATSLKMLIVELEINETTYLKIANIGVKEPTEVFAPEKFADSLEKIFRNLKIRDNDKKQKDLINIFLQLFYLYTELETTCKIVGTNMKELSVMNYEKLTSRHKL